MDTTILSYAISGEHHLQSPCQRLLEAHEEGRITAATTPEVIQEFVHVRSRRHGRTEAADLGRQFAEALTLIATTPQDLELGLDLFERCPNLGAFDAALAAVAISGRAKALVSADRAFGEVYRLHWVDPATQALAELLQ
ncbi:MAG: type II toxin-antitoxin system VapC family toxin [Candidatus Dormibacteraceae bacterium]